MLLSEYIKTNDINKLAKRADLTPDAIRKIARGDRENPRTDTALRIVKATKGAVTFPEVYRQPTT